MVLKQGVTLEDSFPKTSGSKITPGPLGEDPGISGPVEMHSSRRETPSSALTASNGRPKLRKILQIDGLYKVPLYGRRRRPLRPAAAQIPEAGGRRVGLSATGKSGKESSPEVSLEPRSEAGLFLEKLPA